MSEANVKLSLSISAWKLGRAFERTEQAMLDWNRVYARSMRMGRLASRANHFTTPRWKRWWLRYVLWCLVCEVRRERLTKSVLTASEQKA